MGLLYFYLYIFINFYICWYVLYASVQICKLYVFIVTFSYSYTYIYIYIYMLYSVYSVSKCCSVYCFYVNVYCTTATGFQPNCS